MLFASQTANEMAFLGNSVWKAQIGLAITDAFSVETLHLKTACTIAVTLLLTKCFANMFV